MNSKKKKNYHKKQLIFKHTKNKIRAWYTKGRCLGIVINQGGKRRFSSQNKSR